MLPDFLIFAATTIILFVILITLIRAEIVRAIMQARQCDMKTAQADYSRIKSIFTNPTRASLKFSIKQNH